MKTRTTPAASSATATSAGRGCATMMMVAFWWLAIIGIETLPTVQSFSFGGSMVTTTTMMPPKPAIYNQRYRQRPQRRKSFPTLIIMHLSPSSSSSISSDSLEEAGITRRRSDTAVELAKSIHPSIALVIPKGIRNIQTRGSGFVVDFGLRPPPPPPSSSLLEQEDTNHKYTYLITAAHVAAPGYEIGLTFPPGEQQDDESMNNTQIPATVIGRNQSLDLALLRIENNNNNSSSNDDDVASTRRKSLPIAKDLPPVGTTTYAHGYPACRIRGGGPAMTSGIVCAIADGLGLPDSTNSISPPFKNNNSNNKTSSTNENQNENNNNDSTIFVVTDAAMSGGMSGGPLTDINGNVLGVNALIRPDLRALGNYAVSAEEISNFLNEMLEKMILLEQEWNKNNEENMAATTTANGGGGIAAYQVVLFNDPMNKKERVSNILENVAQMTNQDANKVMMEAHTTGRGVIKVFQNRTKADDMCQALRKQDLLVEVQS